MKRIFYWSGPDVNVSAGNFIYDKLKERGYNIVPYYDYKLGEGSNKRKRMLKTYKNIVSIFFRSTKNDIILSHDVFTVWKLALLFKLFGMKRNVCINNFMYEGGGNLKKRIMGFALSQQKIALNSQELKNIIKKGIPDLQDENLFVIPDCLAVLGNKYINTPHTNYSVSKGYVFTGGNTRRDFGLVIEVAQKRPDWKFVVVANRIQKDLFHNAPSNMEIFYNIPFAEFADILSQSEIVFIPLTSKFQGGQLVLFLSALLRKPMVTTDTYTIRTYFDEDCCSFIPVGDSQSAIAKINELKQLSCSELSKRSEKAFRNIIKFDADYCFGLIENMIMKK